MRTRRIAISLGTVLALIACQPADEPLNDPVEEVTLSEAASLGASLVEDNCLTCHAISSDSASPNTLAPSLATVLENNSADVLFDDFRTGIHLGHETMPTFDFSIQETDALVAYLKAIAD